MPNQKKNRKGQNLFAIFLCKLFYEYQKLFSNMLSELYKLIVSKFPIQNIQVVSV